MKGAHKQVKYSKSCWILRDQHKGNLRIAAFVRSSWCNPEGFFLTITAGMIQVTQDKDI